jgi:hypothetical protein
VNIPQERFGFSRVDQFSSSSPSRSHRTARRIFIYQHLKKSHPLIHINEPKILKPILLREIIGKNREVLCYGQQRHNELNGCQSGHAAISSQLGAGSDGGGNGAAKGDFGIV